MSIWKWIIIAGIGFLLLMTLKNKVSSIIPNLPFTVSGSNQSSSLPEPIQTGKEYLEQDYTLPGWLILLMIIILYLMFRK